MKQYVSIKSDSKLVCENTELANTFIKRFCGLMYRKELPEGEGLLIEPCNQIHTFNMKFAIDTIFLDKDNKIVFIDENIMPGKIRPLIKNARKVLELNSGTIAKLGLQTGEQLYIINI
ncbi:MAG: DUF192 domain-containing protein [Eubacterium sp.]